MAAYTALTLLLITLSAYVSANQTTAIQKVESYINEARKHVDQRYRLTYHVAAQVGWINDPNGFSFYKGNYHLFYQFYPYDSVWGPMHWGHVVSKDLVNWDWLPTALVPEDEQCFSGSAVVEDDKLVLMYTAHKVLEKEPFQNQTQYLAYSDDGVNFVKYEGNPVMPSAPNNAPDFRDPKVWKHGDHWYVVLGSKTDDLRGRVLLYTSKNLVDWDFLSVLAESKGDLGYMWECPDFFELNGKYVLLMSPQGMAPLGDRYKNTHQTGYIIGSFNYDTFEFIPEQEFQELDFGHDFYATQTMELNGRRILAAWFGMWEVDHPEDKDGWAGAMTIFRELEYDSRFNRIMMRPVVEMYKLRHKILHVGFFKPGQDLYLGKAAEIIVNGDLKREINLELKGADGGGNVLLRWDPTIQKVIVDRGNGDNRQVEWYYGNVKTELRIFLDTSSLELFCGEGEVVFSSRAYPLGGWILKSWNEQTLFVRAFSLKRGIPE